MAGLFSMPTPEQVRSNARSGLFQQAAQQAQVPRGRGAVQAATQAGGLFGEALGRAAGGQAPGEAEAQRFQAVQAQISEQFKDIDLTDPEKQLDMMGESAKLLAAEGFTQQAGQALNMATQIRNSLPKKSAVDTFSKIDVEKFTPNSIKQFEKTGKRSDLRAIQQDKTKTLSVGEKAIDRAFAKDFVDWTTGGQEDVKKMVLQLKEVQTRLESGEENLTGPIIGRTPDFALAAANPASVDARELVEEVVQRNLKAILGGQFSRIEGEKLVARAYNPALDEAVNAKRVSKLLSSIEKAAEAKQAAVNFFDTNGTLSGFKGQQWSQADIEEAFNDLVKEDTTKKKKGFKIRRVR